MAVWEVGSWREVARTRPLARGAADALAVSARAGAPTGAQPSVLLVSGERAAVWGLSAPTPCVDIHCQVIRLRVTMPLFGVFA